jgi:hypothetical protein
MRVPGAAGGIVGDDAGTGPLDHAVGLDPHRPRGGGGVDGVGRAGEPAVLAMMASAPVLVAVPGVVSTVTVITPLV